MQHVFIDGSVWFPEERILAFADLHLGYEADLRSKGVFVPGNEFASLRQRLIRTVTCTEPRTIVIDGDFKHAFGRISDAEWRHAGQLLDILLQHAKVVLVAGNHDPLLGPLAEKNGLQVVPLFVSDGIAFFHGDALPKSVPDVETVVIGHEHPAVTVRDGPRAERVKCYLVGTWKGKELIVLPSMFSLTEGTDVLTMPLNSPFLDDISKFSVHVLSDGETLYMGTVKDLRKRLQDL